MNNLELTRFGVQELNERMMVDIEGGIFPIIIAGVVISGKTAGWIAAGGLFAAGVYAGLS